MSIRRSAQSFGKAWIIVFSLAAFAFGACGSDDAKNSGTDPSSGGTAGSAGTAGSGGSAGSGGQDAGPDGASGSAGADAGDGAFSIACELPDTELLGSIHGGAKLTFATSTGSPFEIGTATDPGATAADAWRSANSLELSSAGMPYASKVFARALGSGCENAPLFAHVYTVQAAYDGPAGSPGSLAVATDDARIRRWATGFASASYGSDLDERWKTPEKALGQATADPFDIVAVGNGGSIVLTFEPPIQNGAGIDLAIFENGFGDTFLELAYVEVSSDGVHFVRFDSAYLGTAPIAGFGTQEPSLIAGLAGKYRLGFGTGFDLELLRYRPAVQAGQVKLDAITHVRIVDIIGDGTNHDSFGAPVYDPTPTVGSGGFDLEAIAVLHE